MELELGVLSIERKDVTQGALLRAWLEQHVLPEFSDRTLPVDTAVARRTHYGNRPCTWHDSCHSQRLRFQGHWRAPAQSMRDIALRGNHYFPASHFGRTGPLKKSRTIHGPSGMTPKPVISPDQLNNFTKSSTVIVHAALVNVPALPVRPDSSDCGPALD